MVFKLTLLGLNLLTICLNGIFANDKGIRARVEFSISLFDQNWGKFREGRREESILSKFGTQKDFSKKAKNVGFRTLAD